MTKIVPTKVASTAATPSAITAPGFVVVSHDSSFVMENLLNNEDYALFYSRNITNLIDGISAFVKVKYNDKCIVRKARAVNGIKGHQIALGFRTRGELNVNEGDYVVVEKTNIVVYLFRNSDKYIKGMSIATFVSLLLSAIGCIVSIISTIHSW